MKRRPVLCELALWVGIGLLCALCCPPKFLLFLTAIFLVALGLCCRKR